MAIVKYAGNDGKNYVVDAAEGQSVMEAAVNDGVPGIVGQCGGNLACASCHIYVDAAWTGATGTASDMEDEMLDGALAERRPESRLSCQIEMCAAFDGLSVEIAPEQL